MVPAVLRARGIAYRLASVCHNRRTRAKLPDDVVDAERQCRWHVARRIDAEDRLPHNPYDPQDEFARDSSQEGTGFEISVPVRQAKLTRFCR